MSEFIFGEDLPELRVAGDPAPQQITSDVVLYLEDCR